MANRVFVYGLDGVPLWFLNNAREKGYIKNMSKLMDRGVYGNLIAVPPIYTPPNWTSAFTGVDPGVHGIVGFFTYDTEYNLRYYSASDRKVDPVWVIASRHGRKSIVVNVPLTYPPDEIDGYMISGDERYGPPTEKHVYPRSIYSLVRDMGYLIDTLLYDLPENAIKSIYDVMMRRAEVTRELMKRIDWSLTIIVFRGTDYVLHKFLGLENYSGGNPEARIRFSRVPYETMEFLDSEFAKFMDMLDENDTVIIMSDHGHKPRKYYFSLNAYFYNKGLLAFKSKEKKKMSIKELRKNKFLRSLWYLLTPSIKKRVKKLLLKFVEPDSDINPEDIDWPNTKIVSYSNYGAIKVNVKGRDREGVIGPDEYNEFVNRIINMILEDSKKGDVPIVRGVYRLKDIYRDADDPNYPDLIAIPSDEILFRISLSSRDKVKEEIRSSIDYNSPLYWEKEISGHIPEGIYIFSGPAFKSMGLGPDLVMMDIAPYILYLLNLPIPEYIQGHINTSIIKEEWLRNNPIRIAKSRRFKIKSRVRTLRRRIKK